MKAIAYTRAPETRGVTLSYEKKFHSFRVAIEEARAKSHDIVIAAPWVIGDTYEEITESLSRLGGSGVALHIARAK